jgi:hypothetical protein
VINYRPKESPVKSRIKVAILVIGVMIANIVLAIFSWYVVGELIG